MPRVSVITAFPLLWFTAAARRLKLTTLGFVQYVTPLGQFLLAVFAFHEKFGVANFAGFAIIWIALITFSIDSLLMYRDAKSKNEADTITVQPEH